MARIKPTSVRIPDDIQKFLDVQEGKNMSSKIIRQLRCAIKYETETTITAELINAQIALKKKIEGYGLETIAAIKKIKIPEISQPENYNEKLDAIQGSFIGVSKAESTDLMQTALKSIKNGLKIVGILLVIDIGLNFFKCFP